jgi:hypothetical protein
MAILLFLLAVVAVAVIVTIRLLEPEMYMKLRSRGPIDFPWNRPHLKEVVFEPVSELPVAIDTPMRQDEMPVEVSENTKIAKLETLILEKNTLIERLQRKLAAEEHNREAFENVKKIMDAELTRLKTEIKQLKRQERSNV